MTTTEGNRPTMTDQTQPEPVRHWLLDDEGHRVPAYALVQAGNGSGPVELWERSADGAGALNAMTRAAWLSLRGDPVELQLPSGRLLARFVGGCREGRTRHLTAPVRVVD